MLHSTGRLRWCSLRGKASAVTFHVWSVIEALVLSWFPPPFVCRDVCDYYHLSAVRPGDITQQVLHKVSLALINIHTRNGRFIFPRIRGGGRVVGAFLPSCLTEEGNVRVILQSAGSALNLDGHGLIRLTPTNLKQMGVSQVSSVTVLEDRGGVGAKAARRQQLTGGVCPCLGLTLEPLRSSEETGSEERCLYSHRITFQMAPLPKLDKYTTGFLRSKSLTAHAQRSKCDISTLVFCSLMFLH